MFVHIRSFTARTANLKPHEAVRFLNRFLEAMVQVVEIEHGGMINNSLATDLWRCLEWIAASMNTPTKR
jgi:class 3 adenylate cyclase